MAAGEGSRLRPLTDDVPKPMIPIRGKPILERNVRMLARYGVDEIVINLHHRGETIRAHFGDGERFGVRIAYSEEPVSWERRARSTPCASAFASRST